MPFREFSSYFPTDELDAFTAAYEAAWQHLCATGTTHDQAGVLKKNLAQIILASACKGEREVEQLKAIALGSRLIQTQNAMMAARTTADKKLRASLS
jgi:hypothetical protein